MLQKFDVAVIGAGIIGLSCGYYLSREGKSVVVLEKGAFGNGASGACDDMILFQSKKPGINLEMAFESLELYRDLSKELGMELGFDTRGGMVLIQNSRELEIMEDFVEKQREYGLDVRLIDKAEMRKKQPFLNDSFIASTYSPQDSQADPFAVMHGFYLKGKSLGMSVHKQTSVVGIDQDGNGNFILATSDNRRFAAEKVINAAGAWGGKIAAMADLHVPITPKRGQIVITEKIPAIGETNLWSAKYLVTKLQPGLEVEATEEQIELGLAFALTRATDGGYLIGSTRELVGFDNRTTMEGIREVVGQAVEYVPVLKDVHFIRVMAGLRPSTPDGKMILGEHEDLPGFYTAAGHEGDGISLAPVTGRELALLVAGKKGKFNLDELSPNRFTKERLEAVL